MQASWLDEMEASKVDAKAQFGGDLTEVDRIRQKYLHLLTDDERSASATKKRYTVMEYSSASKSSKQMASTEKSPQMLVPMAAD